VIELTDAVSHASLTAAPDNTSATVETGPVGPIPAQDLEAGPELKCIAGVAVRAYRLSAGTFMRVLVRFRSPCQQKMRVAGRRIYLDLMPLQPTQPPPATQPAPAALSRLQPAPVSAPTKAPGSQVPQSAPRTGSPGSSAALQRPLQAVPRPQVAVPQAAVPSRGASSGASSNDVAIASGENPTERAYRALEADALKRAKALVAQGNVKALQTLRDEVTRRDAQLGRKRPDIITNLLNDLDRSTDEARAVRLKLDGLLFRKSQPG
jgi:hypothetical protein